MEVRVIDLDKILRAVDGLSGIDKDRSVRSGLNSAANVFKVGGIKNLNERLGDSTSRTKKRAPGNLKSSLAKRVKKRRPGAIIGFSYPLGYHAHLVDSGTKRRFTKKGKNAGLVTPNNFWHDNVEQNKEKAMNHLFQGIERAVTRIKNRL